ncbi:protein DMP7-like [Impatiens glandulifera]|uniref:protein DMP7-like n=1 Tax=Impatiens glandulifera TaxID=253017 RepID=UPI001FB0CE26|nr:protein DMP7-like [Impatiens glandulifera]
MDDDIITTNEEHHLQQPFLKTKPKKTLSQRAVKKTFKTSSHLASLLPTGTVLFFQILSPVLTHQGKCLTFISRSYTAALLSFCAASCFFLCFTDSFLDPAGKVRHGLATIYGIWVMDSPVVGGGLSPEEAAKYRVRFMDFFHAVLSVIVFVGVALFDKNVVNCFFPKPSDEMIEILSMLPLGIAVVCSTLFVFFPTQRHCIGVFCPAGNTQKVIEKDVTFFFCKDSPPPWFDGSISGDFGFDPLGLGSDSELLKWFAQAELIHSRWAMLAVSGILIPEWLESLGFIEKFSWYDAGAQEYFADSTPLYIF